ncbi:MAG: transmembrane anchor protein [Pseudomonadota bacterium]
MYNAQKPSPDDLPSSAQLLRSTAIALLAAVVILVTVVLPAEYGVDPTRIGQLLGLTEMGEIKSQLADEAEQDHHGDDGAAGDSSFLDRVFGAFVTSAHAQDAEPWRDEVSFTLAPGEGIEWKLAMAKGDTAAYEWAAEGGRVNFDLHGHGGGQRADYEKGRGRADGAGELTAPFAGDHGWFFRNRDRQDVTVILKVRGEYEEFKRTD